ncbi:MAG: glutamate 5-kinase [Deltaproteobacteria bacterium]|nr:glutamate 5-kinase [Deltaproteobacteria bacterium]
MGARDELTAARRVVVKVGSALLAKSPDAFARLAAQVAALRGRGLEVAVVSSGAIALGLVPLGLSSRPRDLPSLQAAAAAGQSRLMWRWGEAFAAHRLEVAQVLLTHGDLRERRRYLNAKSAMRRLLEAGVIPIVNENDSVSVDEIKLGDNDTLAAEVCGLIDGEVVVLLTGAAGLFTADPSLDPTATRIPEVEVIDDRVRALAGPPAALGTGGMVTKLTAAENAGRHGAGTVIAPGDVDDVLVKVFAGEDLGTLLRAPAGAKESARKRWISTTLRPRGTLYVDEGAERALRKHASLLFAGVREVTGSFQPGDPVDVARAGDRAPFARGLVRLNAEDARRVAGMKTAEAQAVVAALPDELIHRDDLVLL